MLKLVNSLFDCFQCIMFINFDCLLSDDRTCIHSFIDIMHGDSGHLHTRPERLSDCVDSRKRRKKRWVNVNDFSPICLKERITDQPHIAGKSNQFNLVKTKLFNDGLFKCSLVFIRLRLKCEGWNVECFRPFDDFRLRFVANEERC